MIEKYFIHFFPFNLIFSEIYKVYQKLYGIDKQLIPENEEVEYHNKLFKPHAFNKKATLSNKVVIIVKVPIFNNQIKEIQISSKQLKLLFTKKNRILQLKLDFKQRIEVQMNQILNQQAKLNQEKLKQQHTQITILKLLMNLNSSISQLHFNQKMDFLSLDPCQFSKSKLSPSKKLEQQQFQDCLIEIQESNQYSTR